MRFALIIGAVATVSLNGCGSSPLGAADQERIEDAIKAFIAPPEEDRTLGCAWLSANGRQDFVSHAQKTFTRAARGTSLRFDLQDCADVQDAVAEYGNLPNIKDGVVDFCLRYREKPIRVTAAEGSGDTAVARVAGSTKRARVRKSNGRWRIDELDYSDVPGFDDAPVDLCGS